MQRTMQGWAYKGMELLRKARQRAEAAEDVFSQVKANHDRATAGQTGDFAVAPGMQLTVRNKLLREGDEVTIEHTRDVAELKAWVTQGLVLTRDEKVKLPRPEYVVAPGKAVTVGRRIRVDGDEVRLKDLEGADMERLLERGLVVKMA